MHNEECVMAQVNPSFSDTDHNPTQTEAGIEVFEVVGSIKWFNASKGYGFITPDNGLADIMLHVTCLKGRRLSDRVRGSEGSLRGAAPAERHAGIPYSRHGRECGNPPFAIATADARCCSTAERLGKSDCQVVQLQSWLRIPHPWRKDCRYFRAQGDGQTLRLRGV